MSTRVFSFLVKNNWVTLLKLTKISILVSGYYLFRFDTFIVVCTGFVVVIIGNWQMESKTRVNCYRETTSSQESQTLSLFFILYSSLAIALLILLVPHQYVDGKFVPGFIFAGRPFLFHAFLFSVLLSFAGASSSLLIGINCPRTAIGRCYYRISMVSMASALLILALALFLEILKLLGSPDLEWWGLLFQVFGRISPSEEEENREL